MRIARAYARCVDVVEFVVVQGADAWPRGEWVEPVINERSLLDVLWHADGGEAPGYSGRGPGLLDELKVAARARTRGQVQLFDCSCGDEGCGWARVEVEHADDRVVWRDVRTRHGRSDRYASIGPFAFARAQYEQALARPRIVAQPPRGAPPPTTWSDELQRLAGGEPSDHLAWLDALDRTTYGDAFERGRHMDVVTLGLWAFAERGTPMAPPTVQRWVTRNGGRSVVAARAFGVVEAVNALHAARRRADGTQP